MEEKRDPLYPPPPAPMNTARAGLVLLAMVAALFVIGFIAFSGDRPPMN